MYEQYFNLQKKPFSIAPDPGFLYLSDKHRDALAHLHYGLQSDGGFVLVTGEVGTGKTTLLRNIIGQVPGDIDVAFILNPRLTVRELLQTICDELGIEYPPDDPHSVKPYIDQLNRHLLRSHGLERSTVVVIDEAQNLSPAVLEQLRLLTNLETNEQKLLRIILVGQPELNEVLSRLELRQLNQRITARYHLQPLKLADTRAYLSHRLKISGGNPALFSKWASWNIHRLAGGIPRLINIIADRALLGAFVKGKTRVDFSTSQSAAKETLQKQSNWLPWIAIVGVLLVLMGGAWAYYSSLSNGDTTTSQQTNAASRSPSNSTAQAISADNPQRTPDPISGDLAGPTKTLAALPPRSAGLSSSRSERDAFNALFERWGVSLAPNDRRSACDYALQFQLRCTRRQVTWTEVVELNVPTVLELRDGSKEAYYLTALRAINDNVTLTTGTETFTVSKAALDEQWFGNATSLWPVPDNYAGPLRVNTQHASVVALRTLLSRTQNIDLGDSDVFDTLLRSELLSFQRQYGLEADGVAGPATWLMLHRAAGYNIPRLTQ